MSAIPERTTFTYESAEQYKASFKTVERNGMFYTDNPDWRQYSVHMTTTSREAADREVQKLVDAWKPE